MNARLSGVIDAPTYLKEEVVAFQERFTASTGDPGAIYSGERVTEYGKYLTSAGVTAGLDMALHLSERLSGRAVAEAIELSLEYDPQPPFGTGNWEAATAERIQLVESYLRN